MKKYGEQFISCPHCGGHVGVILDTTQGNQDFYEDCPVCCHPIHLRMQLNQVKDNIDLDIDSDDEQIF